MKGRSYERVVCPGCARRIAAYAPPGNERGELMVVPHNVHPLRAGDACPVSQRRIVVEHGIWRLAS